MRSYGIIEVGPKANDKSPYKKKAEGDLRHTRHREGGVKTGAAIGVMYLQPRNAEGCQ